MSDETKPTRYCPTCGPAGPECDLVRECPVCGRTFFPARAPWFVALLAEERRKGAEELGLRPEVLAFARAMEAKLRKHDGDRGDSWKMTHDSFLYSGLITEVAEFTDAFTHGLARDVPGEAVDIANFAMFFWAKSPEWCRALHAEPTGGGR